MKKNRLLSCLLLVVAVLAFTGCKKWLELKPLDGIVKEEFWKTKEQVKASVIGIYSSMMEYSTGRYGDATYVPSMAELLFVWGEGRADHVANATASSADDIALINVNIQPTNVNANWRPFYRTINFCNTVIEKAPEKNVSFKFELADLTPVVYIAETLTLGKLIDFIDKEKKELIWQGIGTGALRNENRDKKEERINS